MVGEVFQLVWRLHWKVNIVCMSLSPFVSFQSQFVTYLLTSLHILKGVIQELDMDNVHSRSPVGIFFSFTNSWHCHEVRDGTDKLHWN
jgi:hypothetical protein